LSLGISKKFAKANEFFAKRARDIQRRREKKASRDAQGEQQLPSVVPQDEPTEMDVGRVGEPEVSRPTVGLG
jgi:hypothetical protein